MCQKCLYVNTLVYYTFSKNLCPLDLIKHEWCMDMSHPLAKVYEIFVCFIWIQTDMKQIDVMSLFYWLFIL